MFFLLVWGCFKMSLKFQKAVTVSKVFLLKEQKVVGLEFPKAFLSTTVISRQVSKEGRN